MNLLERAPFLAGPCAYGVHVSRGAYKQVAHATLISDAFRRAALTPRGRLLIIAPIRHGKSTTATHYGTSWYLSLFPENSLLFGTYAANFASLWGERVRNTVTERGLSTNIGMGSRSARNEWTTHLGGGMRSVGVGQKIAGRGADLLVFDDLVGSAQDALSATKQEHLWQWWLGDFTSRRQSMDMPIIGIGARWSENDHMGRLLRAYHEGPGAEGYEPWEIVYLPAIYDGFDWTGRNEIVDPLGRKVGDALWPGKWDIEFLERERASRPWWFAAQYQGRPQPLEGGPMRQTLWNYWSVEPVESEPLGSVFVGGNEKEAHALPAITRMLISVDANWLADMEDLAKGHERSDVSVLVLGLDARGNKYVLDRELGMMDIEGTTQCVLAMRERYKAGSIMAVALGLNLPPMAALIEAKANGPAIMAKLRHKGVTCIPQTPVEGKLARVVGRGDTQAQRYGRAMAMIDDVQAGKILLPHPAMVVDGRSYSWSLDLRHKLAEFPQRGTDDTDALSQGWSRLAMSEWDAEDRAEIADKRAQERVLKQAGLPKGSVMPTTTVEYVAAQARATQDRKLDAMAKRFAQQGRRRRTPFG